MGFDVVLEHYDIGPYTKYTETIFLRVGDEFFWQMVRYTDGKRCSANGFYDEIKMGWRKPSSHCLREALRKLPGYEITKIAHLQALLQKMGDEKYAASLNTAWETSKQKQILEVP